MTSSALTGNTSGLASATSPGLVGITTQTFAGKKTFQDGLAFTSASLSDEQATILGLKQYLHGTTYNGGIAPTVTSALSGFTVSRCSFIPYQAQDGTWRLKFNIAGTYTLSTVASTTITVNGITFKNVTNYTQAVAVFINSSGALNSTASYTNANASTIQITSSATATSNTIGVSSDVELTAKPTWAY